jgi:hypothetical protein
MVGLSCCRNPVLGLILGKQCCSGLRESFASRTSWIMRSAQNRIGLRRKRAKFVDFVDMNVAVASSRPAMITLSCQLLKSSSS